MLLVVEDRHHFHLLQRPEPEARSTDLALQRMGGFASPARPSAHRDCQPLPLERPRQ